MKFNPLFVLVLFVIGSCNITRISHHKQPVVIRSSEAVKLTIDGIELNAISKKERVLLINSNDSLCIQAQTELKSKDFCIPAKKPKWKNERNEWINIFPDFMYLDMDDSASTFYKYVTLNKNQRGKKNVIKLSPFKSLAAISPRMQLSLERVWHKRLSSQLKLAQLIPSSVFDIRSDRNPNNKGTQLAVEQRLYIRPTAPKGTYVSLRLEHLRSRYNDDWTFIDRNSTTGIYYRDDFSVKNRSLGTSFNIGHQWLINRFAVDWNIGVGARYKKIEHYGRDNLTHSMMYPRHPNIYFEANKPGNYWTAIAPVNFSIGYLF